MTDIDRVVTEVISSTNFVQKNRPNSPNIQESMMRLALCASSFNDATVSPLRNASRMGTLILFSKACD
jgi:hypothetical protein